jgi:hypothetical protein
LTVQRRNPATRRPNSQLPVIVRLTGYPPVVARLWERCVRTWRWLDRQWEVHASELACFFAALALIFGLIAGIQRIELHDRHMSVNWGTVPDWIAAIGALATVATLIVAYAVYRHEVSVRSEDQETRRREAERQQADLVTAWVESSQPGTAIVGLINASQGVVYDLRMTVKTEVASGDLASEMMHSTSGWSSGLFAIQLASVELRVCELQI